MANISYLKGVRTKYRNLLAKELDTGRTIIQQQQTGQLGHNWIAATSKCIEMLKTYGDKLEIQSDKLASALDDKDAEVIAQIVDEDCSFCAEAVECVIELKELKDKAALPKKEADTEEKLIDLQSKMQNMIAIQLEQQQNYIKMQAKKQEEFTAVKLPKLEIISFGGDKLRWIEFWDSFESSVHNNKKLSGIEKFNYLKGKLFGEARNAVSGLALSNENYTIAIDILKERFGKTQQVIDLHYTKMIKLPFATNKTYSLRTFLDEFERHLRSLEVLGQDINQDMFISMIKSKLPEEVLFQLEILNGAESKWTIQNLRDRLRSYVVAKEQSEKRQSVDVIKERFSSNKGVHNSAQKYHIQSKFNREHSPKAGSSSSEALIMSESRTPQRRSSNDYFDRCRYCEKRHWSDECPTYRSIEARKERLNDSCFRCLKYGHKSIDCKKERMCIHCGAKNKHHRSLCPEKFQVSTSVADHKHNVNSNPTTGENVMISSGETVLMQTAFTKVKNANSSQSEEVRILLDSGSQRSYITEDLAKRLGLKQTGEEDIKVMTFGSEKSKTVKTKVSSVQIGLKNGQYMRISVNVVPVICGETERKQLKLNDNNVKEVINSVDLADSLAVRNEVSQIEILLGNDYYLDVILCQKMEIQPGLYLLSSKLGWILSGRTSDIEYDRDDVNMLILTHGRDINNTSVLKNVDRSQQLKPDLENFWNIESIGITDDTSMSNDEIAMESFKKTLKFSENRYQVTWPWKDEEVDLPINRNLALGRLKSTLARLRNKPDVFQKYDDIIHDQLKRGIIEKLDKNQQDGLIHYIPHHPVITPQKTTTKLRIVYDASAKARNDDKALNECLYRGPVMLHNLCGILLRFRTHRIGIVADIEKAFHQIGLQTNQRDVTRFLWIKDCEHPYTDNNNIEEYRFCRVPFGVVSSPFILGATIESHLETYGGQLAEKLRQDIYVDNLVTGANTPIEAIELYKGAKAIFNEASMNLREWLTNDDQVNESISADDMVQTKSIKVLGQIWNTTDDTLLLKSTIMHMDIKETKRSVLSAVSSVFDPLGLFAPVVLRGKLVLQNLWLKGRDWDDEIDEEDYTEWCEIKENLIEISDCKIPRCVSSFCVDSTNDTYIICFCDASEKAYACVIYLKCGNNMKPHLVFAKTRIAPLKAITIPRLELMSILIGVRCIKFVKSQLKLKVCKTYLWSDSKCALQWLSTEKQLPRFVQNRVSEIKSNSDFEYSYIQSKENPADIASRGISTEKLMSSNIWWHGPPWLTKPICDWPSNDNNVVNEIRECDNDINRRGEDVQLHVDIQVKQSVPAPFGIDINAFSSFSKLIRVTAYASRFVKRIKGDEISTEIPLTSKELIEAEKQWIRYTQQQHFPEEIDAMSQNKSSNLQRQLGLLTDESGLIRCRGRMENTTLTYGAQCPILLPKKDKLTELIVDKTHISLLHSGVSQTLSQIRQTYWIIQGRATVKHVIQKCRACRRYDGGPYKMPQMSPLPKTRVTESVPFSKVGIDYFGPLFIKTLGGPKKVWVCLFTCLVIRAIHLELVVDMTTEEFLLALRRFVAQRGVPSEIISDNALQFKTANKTLQTICSKITKSEDVQSYASELKIKWTFIVELAPWMGGFYERLVGVVKKTLRKTLGRKLLTVVQLQTLIKEIEALVNSRPLVYVNDDINSNAAITPSHFLSMNRKVCIQETDSMYENDTEYKPYNSSETKLLELWKKGQRLLDTFWKLWHNDYLLSLRERTQTKLKQSRVTSTFSPQVGDVIVVKDNVSRGNWRLGKIVEVLHSSDGEIRSVKLKLASGRIIGRPLNLLYPLEVSGDKSNKSTECKSEDENKLPMTTDFALRPKRAAAKIAEKRITGVFQDQG